ncbi:MAG TPA: hypothetical protein VK148_06875 [Xanthobacteraceae bacterium]|jgi:hypothetical protein|nr:hypothetical protein [Xanthobacteraceae bacterium]
MSAIQSSVSAPASSNSALGTLKSGQSPVHAKAVEKTAANLERPSTIGPLGILVLLSGICIAVGGTLWAIELDVPYPVAVMAGYCTFIASACLCVALMVLRKTSTKVAQPVSSAAPPATNSTTPAAARGKPNYAAWKLVSKFSVSDASRLWCDIEPGCPATQESIAWAHAILDAIKRSELIIIPRSGLSEAMRGPEQVNPSWTTEVGRESLKTWAQAHGHAPRFLQS